MTKIKWNELRFEEEKPDYGDEIPIDEWQESVEFGMFTDYDGIGLWMKGGKLHSAGPGEHPVYSDNVCDPEEIEEAKANGIEAVMWFNK